MITLRHVTRPTRGRLGVLEQRAVLLQQVPDPVLR